MQLLDIIILVAVLGVCFALWKLMDSGSAHGKLQKRIEQMKQRKVSVPKATGDVSLRRKTREVPKLVQTLMKPLPNFKSLGDTLERAGKTISPQQFAFRSILVTLVIALVIAFVLHKSLIMGLAVGFILGFWIPFKMLQMGIAKQSKAFLQLFPDAIDLIVRGLRSGLPVSESLVLVSQEVPDPVGAVFRNITNTMKLGVPMEKGAAGNSAEAGHDRV
jgi:tight adherence protein B